MATQRSNGKWRAQVLIGTDENGKRLYKSFEADTEDEADYDALTFKLGKGKRVEQKNITLRAAIEGYINSKEDLLSPATVTSYRCILKNFGNYLDIRINNVTRINLQTAITKYANQPKQKKHNGNGKISSKTVRNAYGLINATLKQNDIHIDGITLPQKQKITYNTPFDAELTAIFKALEGSSLEIPALLAAWCSLRRSEILGLQFKHVDFEAKTITVNQALVYVGATGHLKGTKTESSTRTVFLSEYIANKIKNIQAQRNAGPDDFIVTIKGGSITKCFNDKLRKANLPICRFHDLRHSFVSILTAKGIDQKYIQEMGGWSDESDVMNVNYKQTQTELKRQISYAVDTVFLKILQPDATNTTIQTQQNQAL